MSPMEEANRNTPIPTTPTNFPLEKWPQAITVISSLTAASAVLYNWSYFSVAAPFAIQFLTVSDQISSALKWLPGIALWYAFGAFAGPFIPTKIIPGRVESKTRQNILLVFAQILFFSVPVMLLTLYFILAPSDWAPILVPLAGMSFFATRALELKGLPLPHPTFMNVSILLLIMSIAMGNGDALADFARSKGNVSLTTKDGSHVSSAVFLRNMENGVLLLNLNIHKTEFIPWDNVSTLSFSYSPLNAHSRICNDIGIFCRYRDPDLLPSK